MVENAPVDKLTLLVADDNEGLATLICKRLRAGGYNAEVRMNGVSTIDYIKSSPPALLLLDFRLPDMTGQEVITALQEANSLIPFIVVTGAGDESTAVEMMKLGARDYLRKDLDFLDRINGTVERVFSQIKTEEQLAQAQQALRESEERFKDIIYSMDDIVYETDAQLKFTYCSTQVIDVLGYSPEELIGINPFDLLDSEDRQQIIDLAYAGFTDHMPIKDFEGWYKKKDNQRVCLLMSGVPIFDSQGNFCGIRGASKNITDRKMAEIALSQNEAKYRSLVMNSDSGITLTDEKGTVIEWNPAQERMTGMKAKDVCGLKIWEVQYRVTPIGKRTPAHLSYLQKVTSGWLQNSDQRPVYIQSTVEIQRIDGERRTLDTTVFSLPTKKGIMLSSISYDITEKKRAEEELKGENEQLRQQIQEMQSEKKRLLAGNHETCDDQDALFIDKSPELRASLTKIVNSANTLITGVMGTLNDEQLTMLKDIVKNSKYMTKIVNEILDRSTRLE